MKIIHPSFVLFPLLLASCGSPLNSEPSIAPSANGSFESIPSSVSSSSDSLAESSSSDDRKAVELIIRELPSADVFFEGDTFNPEGMVVDAVLSDGTKEENAPFRVLTKDPLTKPTTTIAIAYRGCVERLTINVTSAGNKEEYSVANFASLPSSPLQDKVFLFLGSSVTYGEGSFGEAIPDYLAKKHGCTCIKEAVSGTTLADLPSPNGKSYITRLEEYLAKEDKAQRLDGFILQLSTNDIRIMDKWGEMEDTAIKDASAFDRQTTIGAMEAIIANVQSQYGCPIYVYTNSYYNDVYGQLVSKAIPLTEKWGITLLNLHDDKPFNAITEEERALYMNDTIHPSRAGYRDWWLPKFEEMLQAN